MKRSDSTKKICSRSDISTRKTPQQSVHHTARARCRSSFVACSNRACHFSTSTEKISRGWLRSLSPPPPTHTRHLPAPLSSFSPPPPPHTLSLSLPLSEREISRNLSEAVPETPERRYPRKAQHGYNCNLHQVYRRISAVRRARKVSDRAAAFV